MAPTRAFDNPGWPWGSAIEKDRTLSIRPPKHQQTVLQIVAITSASTSLLSAIVTVYWFSKMRRGFRHNLILSMILSDLIKGTCYIVYPIALFAKGTIPGKSAFCQATGFFIALGIEATDYGILVLAVHTAMCVFRPSRSSKESGLYHYRYIVYGIWMVFPVMMASLAFTNVGSAYMTQGTSCYLPIRPLWYRLALSWIPRYLVFVTIFAIYTAIFVWVKYHFRKLNFETGNSYARPNTEVTTNIGEQASRIDSGNDEMITEVRLAVEQDAQNIQIELRDVLRNRDRARTPKLNRHGHIPSTAASSRVSSRTRENSAACSDEPLRVEIPYSPHYDNLDSSYDGNMSDPFLSRLKALEDKANVTLPDFIQPMNFDVDSGVASMSEIYSPHADSTVVGILDALRDPKAQPNFYRVTRATPHRLKRIEIEGFAKRQMRKRQRVINRQLRLIFVYPVTYCLVWFVPFVNHCLQYSDSYVLHPPFVFLCFSGFALAIQTAVYCWLFNFREKPWKHIPGSDGTLLGSFMFWKHVSSGQISLWHPRRRQESHGSTIGRTNSAIAVETSLAYLRRDRERADAIKKHKTKRKVKGNVTDKGEMNWWDSGESMERSRFDPLASARFDGSQDLERVMKPCQGMGVV